ncbi:MAG TPA: GAF domain-containing protein, partial [Polyangiaceae bacterium]|nr:GAF domain-containing protein [Polyangiaceae bacterium]
MLPIRSSSPVHPGDPARLRRADHAFRLLADATAILSESLDCGETLSNLARSLVPSLGEACSIQLLEGGELHTVAVAGAAFEREPTLRTLRTRVPTGNDGVEARVTRTGCSETVADMTYETACGAGEVEDVELLRALGARCLFVAALKVRRETLGVITLASARRAYDERDRDLIEEIASRAALAVEHARLHRDADAQRARLRIIADTSRALAAELDVGGVARAIARVMQCGVLVALVGSDGSFVVRACASIDDHVERSLQPLIGCALGLQPGTIADEVLRRR